MTTAFWHQNPQKLARKREESETALTDLIQVVTLAANRSEAEQIAARLIDDRLAACVQVTGPVRSTYRWQGRTEHSEEWQCVIKTTLARYPALEQAIRQLHSYEVPEILATPIVAGSAAYLAWLHEQVRDV